MVQYYVGMGVHSKESVFGMADEQGKVHVQGKLATTAEGFHDWQGHHQAPSGTTVAVESGTVAFFVARQLRAVRIADLSHA